MLGRTLVASLFATALVVTPLAVQAQEKTLTVFAAASMKNASAST